MAGSPESGSVVRVLQVTGKSIWVTASCSQILAALFCSKPVCRNRLHCGNARGVGSVCFVLGVFLDARRYFGKWPVLKRNPTRCGSRACQTAVVLANPVPEGGTSLASWPEKLQAARLPSPVPKSAGAHLGALGVSGSEVFVGRGIWTR